MCDRGSNEESMFEKRPYFVIGDLVSNAGAGAVVGSTIALVVGDGWPVPAGMAAGMALGGLVATILSAAASLLFGALEIMLPVMTTGMAAGMLVGMRAAAGSAAAPAATGALTGVAVLAATYILNAHLRARGTRWTS